MNPRPTILVGVILVLTAMLAACATAEPASLPAEGSTLLDAEWELVSLNGSALIEGRAITLRFGEASLEGSGGCNTYGGSYTASKDSLRLSDVYWTEMACIEPEGIMGQEQAYFQTLNIVAGYRVDGDRLELYDEAGAQILAFVAVGGPSAARVPSTPEPPTATVLAAPTESPTPQEFALIATVEAQDSLPTGAVVKVRFTLTNSSSEGFFVLKWFTPLEGLAGDIFRVQRDGVDLLYRGKLVKRGPPTSEDYVWIDAGGSISAEVDLAEGYDFSRAGEYTLKFRSPRLSHTAKTSGEQADSFDELAMIRIPSNPVSVTIERPSGSQGCRMDFLIAAT